jgi:hypothetical protein
MGSFDLIINDLIEVSAADGYTVIAPGRYRVLPQADGGAELIRLDRRDKCPMRLTATQWALLDGMVYPERDDVARHPYSPERTDSRRSLGTRPYSALRRKAGSSTS